MDICAEVNVILLNTNLSGYNVINKATTVMSKYVETGIINFVLLFRFKLNLLSCHKAPKRKI